jgi:SAM-dependent methyltransferase
VALPDKGPTPTAICSTHQTNDARSRSTRDHQEASSITRFLRKRFAFLLWPVDRLAERVQASRGHGLMNPRAEAKRYPMRAIRYWWTDCALRDEIQAANRELVIADVGCSSGIIKRYIGDLESSKWVGLDWSIDEKSLKECGYAEWHQCDFDGRLPLDDASVDVVIFLHVIEHLPRPEWAMAELVRILKPGGLLLAGSPVAPRFAAMIRDHQLKREMRLGLRKPGAHVNSMHPARWRALARNNGLQTEILTGSFLLRWSSSPLENNRLWLRLNQLWGALVPGIGGEIYLAARRPSAGHATKTASPGFPSLLAEHFGKLAWAMGTVALLVLVSLLLLNPSSNACPISDFIKDHQDGNDAFYGVPHPNLQKAVDQQHLTPVTDPDHLHTVVQNALNTGRDPHVVVSDSSGGRFTPTISRLGMRSIKKLKVDGHGFETFELENGQ